MLEKNLTKTISIEKENKSLIEDLYTIIDEEHDLKFDNASRMMYSTDASIYQMEPICIIFPKNVLTVSKIVAIANKHNVPIVPRGAGTSLAGQAINNGIMIDFSKYMNNVIEVNRKEKWAKVQPGIVVSEFNKILESHGLQYAIDTSTKNRATIGGGIGNNSCGTHSIIYGKTIDQVQQLQMVLSDSTITTFQNINYENLSTKAKKNKLITGIYQELPKIVDKYNEEIKIRFPKIDRRVSGYNLDAYTHEKHTGNEKNLVTILNKDAPIDLTKIIVGSEGTLGIVTEAKVRLVDLPKYKALVVSTYNSIIDAAEATNDLLEFTPAAIELVDKNIIHGCIENPGFRHLVDFLEDKPEAMLIAEFFGDTQDLLQEKIDAVFLEQSRNKNINQILKVTDESKQENIWKMRQAGLGLLMNIKGDAKPLAFVEDTAVAPKDLPNFLFDFQKIIDEHHTTAGFYGHASVGCLHIRPMINIKKSDELTKMHSIAEKVADLVLKYDGSLSGEHGDGILRGVFTEKMFGKEITQAFRDIKNIFDPKQLMNPGKIIDTPKFSSHLKISPTRNMLNPVTKLDFSDEESFRSLVEQCNGQGACRKFEGVMCPSYMATMDEEHSTRGRANLIRELLTDTSDQNALLDNRLIEALDLCVGCKACKIECPSQVDMAKLKTEILHQYQQKNGTSLRTKLLININKLAKIGSHFPKLANLLASNSLLRMKLHFFLGIHKDAKLPKLTGETFYKWFKNNSQYISNKKVLLFIDTFTNYFDPSIGRSAIKLINALGYAVEIVEKQFCCGRPAISKGQLNLAKELAENTVKELQIYSERNTSIIFLEPSCFSAIQDDYKSLIDMKQHEKIIINSMLFEEFIIRHEQSNPGSLKSILNIDNDSVAIHPHCHQKALGKGNITSELLNSTLGIDAYQIESTCCGMAGSFGIEKEHYEISKNIAELGLINQINKLNNTKTILTTGTSCRQQILQHANIQSMHLAEYLSKKIK
jgi:FAD/FMN-containing dehydrogenase/Fe-S oxidoreductase